MTLPTHSHALTAHIFYLQFQGVLGLSHSGILKATLNKFATIDPVLTSVVNAHPTYPVLIVGHSLGGGVAQLFTLLTLSSHPDWKIKCFSFGGANKTG
ncbi:hypothetical protein Pelo_19920 [Pelomyxa schiedti]|nr:hypothetical protein Pelo_19920 [Pelomyxa schiedti]